MTKAAALIAKNTDQKTVYTFLSMLLVALVLFMGSAFAGSPSQWHLQETKVKGTWMIEERADGNYLVLSDDFKTSNGPDLKFFVSKKPYGTINGDNATTSAVQLATLGSNKGGQSFKIADGVNLDDYQSLILHCEKYSKLWAATPLQK